MQASKKLRSTYWYLLSGNVVSPETNLPVDIYDSYAPDNAKEPYIILTVPSITQMARFSCDTFSALVTVDVVTKFDYPLGMGLAESLAAQVDAIIRPSRMIDIAGVAETTIEGVRPIISKDGQKYVFRQLITYNHVI